MSKPTIDKEISIPEEILKELLTPSEWRMLKNRWRIRKLLEEGLSVRKIAAEVSVGTDTVVRTIRRLESKNLKSKTKKQIKSLTPWIFGKTKD